MLSPQSIRSFGNELSKIAAAKPKKEISKVEVKKLKRDIELWNKLRGASPVKIRIDRDADLHGGGYFDQQAKEIGLSSKDYETLAHELGHAELDKKIIGRFLQGPTARGLFDWTPVAGAVAGAGLARGKKLPMILPFLTAAPTLISEHWATVRGAGRLESAGATAKEVEKYRKQLRSSLGTYGSTAPISAMAALMGHAVAS
jgi:hypothetical protein